MLKKYDFHEYISQRHKIFIVGSEIFSSLLYCYMFYSATIGVSAAWIEL